MSKEMTVIVLGLLVAALPYLGIPGSLRTMLLVLIGLGLALIGFLLRGETLSGETKISSRHPFVENKAPQQLVRDSTNEQTETDPYN
jgi:hypothetical protein